MDYDVLERLIAALESHGVRYAVFGAVALTIHGLARFTEDVDLFVAPDPENVESLRAAFRSVFDDPAIDDISATDLSGDYPAIQYGAPDGTFHIDVVSRLGDAFAFSDLEIARVPFGAGQVAVVTPRTLYRMKRDTVRLKDRADAEMLRRRFDLEDE